MKFYVIIFLLITQFANLSFSEVSKSLEGYWFQCEYSGKNTPPDDDCKMLDNDGFKFEKNNLIHTKNIESLEENCKKNKIGQCFKFDTKSIVVKFGRKDKINIEKNNLILSFLGCNQKYKLIYNENYLEAVPDVKKCFWAGKKHFFLRKYKGKIIKK
ncbi:MAG: hypothetical protein CMN50_02230 [SAR116 cluster bacterium]|nr:hypothetical protein [SAR116 cluster bacterium]|tara:strand:- start:628 stop:1098 length:471 start_codon:yes stop_codon:yes gene_type:complete